MKINRTKNAKRNIFWGLVNKCVVTVGPFIVRTTLINILGMQYVGLSSLFTSIISILNMSELGVGVAIVYNMYKPIADDNTEQICALLNLYKKIYRCIGIFIASAGLIMLPFLSKLVEGDVPVDINIYILYLLYLTNTVLTYWMFAYKICLVTAHQRNDVDSKIYTLASLVQYSLQVVLLLLFRNYYLFVIGYLVFTIIHNVGIELYTRKFYPQYVGRGKVSRETLQGLKNQVGGLLVVKIATASRNSLDSIIVSSTLGLVMVGIYNNYLYIMNAVVGVLSVICVSLSGGIGNSLVCDSKEKNMADMSIINYGYLWICGCAAACMVAVYQPFMKLWVGSDYLLPDIVMGLFVLYFILSRMTNVVGQYLDAAGLFSERKGFAILEAVANLTLNIVLGKLWGLVGILLATIITVYFINFLSCSYIVYKNCFHEKCLGFCIKQTLYIVLISASVFLTFLISNTVPNGNGVAASIVFMSIRLLVGILIFNFVMWLFLNRNKSFNTTLMWVKQKIIKR